MGNIIKTLIFMAILVAVYFAFAGIYGSKNTVSTEVGSWEGSIQNAAYKTGDEIKTDIEQSAENIKAKTDDALISAESAIKNATK